MTNPENTALMNGHFGLRGHPPDEICIRSLRSEINWLQKRLPDAPGYKLAVSDHIPTGFLAQTDYRTLFGIFPSCGSYHIGPMIEIDRNTEFWDVLNRDWDERWKA